MLYAGPKHWHWLSINASCTPSGAFGKRVMSIPTGADALPIMAGQELVG
jgi:hypothetical protein